MDAPLPRNFFKIYNLRTANAVKMKCTTVVYLHETFHLTKDLGVAHRAWPKTSQKKPKNRFFGSIFRIFRNISKTVTYVILCLALHHWWKFCTNGTWFGLVIYQKPPKSSQKSYFLLVWETLNLYNLTTTNAIKMNLTRIVYLHETFHLQETWGIHHTGKWGVVEKSLKTSHKMRFLG